MMTFLFSVSLLQHLLDRFRHCFQGQYLANFASFPDPTQLSIACSMEKQSRGKPENDARKTSLSHKPDPFRSCGSANCISDTTITSPGSDQCCETERVCLVRLRQQFVSIISDLCAINSCLFKEGYIQDN